MTKLPPVDVFSENVRASMKSGRSTKQAIASALAIKRRDKLSQVVKEEIDPNESETLGEMHEEGKFPAGAEKINPDPDKLPDNYDMPPSSDNGLSDDVRSAIVARKNKRRYPLKE